MYALILNVYIAKLFAIFIYTMQVCNCESIVRVPPKVDGPPRLLDSFIPASMQIMAHLTELMKYDLKPTATPITTTSTTIRPTPSHKPGIYAPEVPPGPEAYFSRGSSFEEYVNRLQNPLSGDYFDRYYFQSWNRNKRNRNPKSYISYGYEEYVPDDVGQYFGKEFANTLGLANYIEDNFQIQDSDAQVQEFSQNFDDSDFRFILLRQKKVPPTKAYVSLLALYDLLNKESKRLGLNKFQGYSESVLKELAESSTGTSAYQLRYVLNRIVERGDTKQPQIINKIKQMVADLDKDNSYINDALRYIPPLPFIL